jgi:NitT/TauT family transport system permease protein
MHSGARAPEAPTVIRRTWGEALALLDRTRKLRWMDLVLLCAAAGLLAGVIRLARGWSGELQPAVEIDLSPRALPGYALLSLSRGLAAYALSLLFTLGYGYWAAKDRRAGRILVPLLDILQSIPVLGFMPGLVLGLVAAFPRSNVGLELAAVLMIFTGQAWNMTFSFYHSLRSVPRDLAEAAAVGRFGWWQRLRWVELPFAAIGLVWNSMMSMAGGWFFLMVSEAFVLGDKDFRLPGLGSYMSAAVARDDGAAMAWAVAAMVAMIVVLDQLLWRPAVVWSQKFRVEESGQAELARSWFLDALRRSRLVRQARLRLRRRRLTRGRARPPPPVPVRPPAAPGTRSPAASALAGLLLAALLAGMAVGTADLVRLLRGVAGPEWSRIALDAARTLGRVLAATALGTLWTLPAGLAIGLHPRLSRLAQPVVQVVASFPAPMLFPAAVAVLKAVGVGLGWGSVVLMLLGTQWYVLFNVVAGASSIPADLREAARLYRMGAWQRFRDLYAPAVFPFLLTGWVTAAGGAWNASIVSEYVTFRGQVLRAEGLGALISEAAAGARLPALAASVVVMSAVVVLFNRAVWRPLNGLAERRFSLTR